MSEQKIVGQTWRPSYTAHIPWLSLAFMASFVGCCVGLGVVLASSDDRIVDTWPSSSAPLPVSVILSLLVGVANVCLTGALRKGYEIAWWTKATRGAELHRLRFDLNIQGSISAMLTSSAALNRFSFAALITLIVTISDGPIIQKASRVVAKTRDPTFSQVDATVLGGYLPANFSGYGPGAVPDLFTPLFRNVSRAYQNRDAIQVPISDCSSPNTTCTLDFPGLGWDVSCNETLKPYDFSTLAAATLDNNNLTTYSVSSTYDYYNPSLYLTTTYKPDSACAGNFVERTCALRLSTVNYPLTVTNGTATLASWDATRNNTIAWSNITHDYGNLYTGSSTGDLETMLGGIHGVLNNVYGASAQLVLRKHTTRPYVIQATGSSASNYLTANESTYGFCSMTWSDPTADYINTARELMLRSVLSYANTAPQNTSTTQLLARMTIIATSYETDYTYLYATMAIMGLHMMTVLFLLSGFHNLGRAVSLDTFEIARALATPLLQGGSTNSDIDTTIQPIRHLRLKYGEVNDSDPDTHVAHGGTEMVSDVSNGTYSLISSTDKPMHRLGLVEEHRASEIRKDVLY